MSSIQSTFYEVINYFHKDGKVNRVTFGLDKLPYSSYFLRWRFADVLFVLILFVLYTITYWLEPFQRQFFINDLTILHPFAEHERVPEAALFFYAVWVPLSIVGIVSLIATKPKNKLYVTFISLLGVTISVLLTSVVTDILKNFIGRHRPDFLSRCIPKKDAPRDIMVFAKDVCTTDNMHRLLDGFRTTPLGHSSISFAGLGYLLFWLSGQLIITNEHLGLWRTVVAWIPAFGALLIALSRTEDYRHHFIDIIIGSLIGFSIAYWSYRRLFPSLSDPRAYEPKLIISENLQERESYDRLEEQV